MLQKGVGGGEGLVGSSKCFIGTCPPASRLHFTNVATDKITVAVALVCCRFRGLTAAPCYPFSSLSLACGTRQLAIAPELRMRIWLDQALFNGGGQGWLHKRFATRTINLISFCFLELFASIYFPFCFRTNRTIA